MRHEEHLYFSFITVYSCSQDNRKKTDLSLFSIAIRIFLSNHILLRFILWHSIILLTILILIFQMITLQLIYHGNILHAKCYLLPYLECLIEKWYYRFSNFYIGELHYLASYLCYYIQILSKCVISKARFQYKNNLKTLSPTF